MHTAVVRAVTQMSPSEEEEEDARAWRAAEDAAGGIL